MDRRRAEFQSGVDGNVMRVLIADDHPLFREGLHGLLETRGFDVVAHAATGAQAVELSLTLQPDLVLMDLNMPEMGGLTATRLICARQPQVKVVVLTASDDQADVFEAIKSGANGYLRKNVATAEFFRLLDGLLDDEPQLTPSLASKLLTEFNQSGHAEPPPLAADYREPLTEREKQVLQLLTQGTTTTLELAAHLVVSQNTIKFHLRNILDKLHMHNRAQVVAYASRYGAAPQLR